MIVLFFFPQRDGDTAYEFKDVVQKPIAPAYKEILDKTRNISLKHQGYVVKEEPQKNSE